MPKVKQIIKVLGLPVSQQKIRSSTRQQQATNNSPFASTTPFLAAGGLIDLVARCDFFGQQEPISQSCSQELLEIPTLAFLPPIGQIYSQFFDFCSAEGKSDRQINDLTGRILLANAFATI